jgi:hypothetical protein
MRIYLFLFVALFVKCQSDSHHSNLSPQPSLLQKPFVSVYCSDTLSYSIIELDSGYAQGKYMYLAFEINSENGTNKNTNFYQLCYPSNRKESELSDEKEIDKNIIVLADRLAYTNKYPIPEKFNDKVFCETQEGIWTLYLFDHFSLGYIKYGNSFVGNLECYTTSKEEMIKIIKSFHPR